MKKLSLILLFFLSTLTYAQENTLKTLAHLPEHLQEISGIEILEGSPLIWAIIDSGNSSVVYGFNTDGEIVKEVEIEDVHNIDWEDLAIDKKGTLYVGDFGNNESDREDLAIYIVKDFLDQEEKAQAEKIEFSFEDQENFPAKKDNRNFGSEAFIYKDGNLYLFTKNRSKNPDGTVNLYQIPAKAGKYKAKKISSFQTCDSGSHECWITAASISEDEKSIVLLSEKYVWKLTDFTANNFFNGKILQYELPGKSTQKESICFKDKNTVYIADEQESKKKGRNLYEFSLK
tara:strand:+ start:871 stop:1734 length:864 start_codon:yes stop_codon:yes gene_type:complete